MLEVIFLFVIGFLWILFASINDIKTREVPNWLNFSLIVFVVGFRFFYSLFQGESFAIFNNFFYQGLVGLGIFIILGNLLYYGRMFAGGDAKLMMALGPVLAFSNYFLINLKIFVGFLFVFLFAGAIYGLIVTTSLSVRNFNEFKKEFIKKIKEKRKLFFIFMFFGVVIMLLGFWQTILFPLGILLFVFPYLYIYAKTVDEVCMVKDMKTKDLTEGEWLNEDLKIGRKIIKNKWEGLSEEEIKLIKKNYKKIKIKQGIPFVPVFLIAFVVLIYVWQSGLWYSFW